MADDNPKPTKITKLDEPLTCSTLEIETIEITLDPTVSLESNVDDRDDNIDIDNDENMEKTQEQVDTTETDSDTVSVALHLSFIIYYTIIQILPIKDNRIWK